MSSDEEEPVAWLRRQVEARLALAREASPKTDGHWWRRTDERGDEVSHLWAGEAVHEDGLVWCGEYVVVYDEGAPSDAQFDHMAANDPQDTIARCEAELAILDEHGPDDTFGPDDVCCCACGDRPQVPYPCRTVRLLAGGYRRRPGFPAAFAADPTQNPSDIGAELAP